METVEYETPKEFKARMHARRMKEVQKATFRRKYGIKDDIKVDKND